MFKSKLIIVTLAVLTLLSTAPGSLFAAYRHRDSIEEFGERRFVRHAIQTSAEKRFIKPMPARLKAGPIIFHPTLETSMTYDDNIFLSDQDAVEDIVFDIIPGAIIEIPIDTHQIVIGYEADFEVFTKRDKQNDQNQNAFALIDLNFPDWYINVLDTFRETSGRAGTTFTGRIPRYDHTINPKIGYRWNRFVFEQSFAHTMRDFRKQVNDSLDYEVTEWSSVIWFDLFARLKALTEYTVGQIDYDDNFLRKGTFHQARVGLEGHLMPNLKANIKVGGHWRNYKEGERNNFNSWVGSLVLDYSMRENLGFELEFSREPVESTFNDSNFYTEHSIRFGADYEVLPQWTLYSDSTYYRHDYSERATIGAQTIFRHDHHFSQELGLRYAFREWMDWKLAYKYTRRNSNFSTLDYTNTRLSLSSSIYY